MQTILQTTPPPTVHLLHPFPSPHSQTTVRTRHNLPSSIPFLCRVFRFKSYSLLVGSQEQIFLLQPQLSERVEYHCVCVTLFVLSNFSQPICQVKQDLFSHVNNHLYKDVDNLTQFLEKTIVLQFLFYFGESRFLLCKKRRVESFIYDFSCKI